jgi:hypothetical protein
MVKEQPIGGSSSVDLKRLFSGYVDDGKRREIEDYFARKGITNLQEVTHAHTTACRLLGLAKPRTVALRKELYQNGFFTEVPVVEILSRSKRKGAINPYLNPKIVGEEGVERTRRIVLASDEFREDIEERYPSLFDVGVDFPLNNLVGIGEKNAISVLRRWLFEHGYCQELDLDSIFEDGNLVRLDNNPYLDPEVIGEKNVRRFREQIWDSDEFAKYVCGDFESLLERPIDLRLASLCEVGTNIVDFWSKLHELNFFTEIPVAEVLRRAKRKSGAIIPYLNSGIVGDMVEHYRRIIIDSDEFGAFFAERNYGSLQEIKQSEADLALIFGLKYEQYTDTRKKVYEAGFLTELPIEEAVDSIRFVRGRLYPYFDPEIVGDMVEHYKRIVFESDEFKELVYGDYPILDDVSRDHALAGVLGERWDKPLDIRRKLYQLGFYTEIPVESFMARWETGKHPGSYFDPEIVGEDVEKHREAVLRSDEFAQWVRSASYNALKSKRVSTLLDCDPKVSAVKTELRSRGLL